MQHRIFQLHQFLLNSQVEQIHSQGSSLPLASDSVNVVDIINDISPAEHEENMQKTVEPKNDVVDDSDMYSISSFSL